MLASLEKWVTTHVEKDSLLWNVLRHSRNVPKLITQPKLLHQYIQREIIHNGMFLYEDELYMASLFPKKILDKAIEFFQPKTVLDLGCGIGKSLDYFLSHSIDVVGVDGSKIAISHAKHPERIIPYNLTKELRLKKTFDLIWSFEFVEHIHPQFTRNLLQTFSNHSDTIVMSAAKPGQGGSGHFNEQPAAYWIEQMSTKGYRLNENLTSQFHSIDETHAHNILVFQRSTVFQPG